MMKLENISTTFKDTKGKVQKVSAKDFWNKIFSLKHLDGNFLLNIKIS